MNIISDCVLSQNDQVMNCKCALKHNTMCGSRGGGQGVQTPPPKKKGSLVILVQIPFKSQSYKHCNAKHVLQIKFRNESTRNLARGIFKFG